MSHPHYFCFRTPLDASYDDMNNADSTNVNALIATAEHYLRQDEVIAPVDGLADLLR